MSDGSPFAKDAQPDSDGRAPSPRPPFGRVGPVPRRESVWAGDVESLLADAVAFAGREAREYAAALEQAAARFRSSAWSVLVAGLCSVGKSSFVSALWGDSELLPTAVRDCTQTNTYVRAPAAGEADRQVRLSYLSRAEAAAFVTKGFSYHRLAEMLATVLGPHAPRLDEMSPEPRLRATIAAVKKAGAQRPDLLVLHDYVADELEQLEQFVAFLDAPAYRPGETVPASWDERRDLLMGRRRPDGRTLDVGKLWTLRRVELVRRCESRWRNTPPVLIDTPWIPLFHEARRVDLIVEQALHADILVLLALPQLFQCEDWVPVVLRERPDLAQRTLVVFNQVDTVDALALYARDGFVSDFKENARRLAEHGIPAGNLYMACARLPFLAGLPQDAYVAERAEKLRKVLASIRKRLDGRPEGDFKARLAAACDPEDAGIVTLRRRLEDVAAEYAARQRAREALAALDALRPTLTLAGDAARAWSAILDRAEKMRRVIG